LKIRVKSGHKGIGSNTIHNDIVSAGECRSPTCRSVKPSGGPPGCPEMGSPRTSGRRSLPMAYRACCRVRKGLLSRTSPNFSGDLACDHFLHVSSTYPGEGTSARRMSRQVAKRKLRLLPALRRRASALPRLVVAPQILVRPFRSAGFKPRIAADHPRPLRRSRSRITTARVHSRQPAPRGRLFQRRKVVAYQSPHDRRRDVLIVVTTVGQQTSDNKTTVGQL
jgi:hypothetical protein